MKLLWLVPICAILGVPLALKLTTGSWWLHPQVSIQDELPYERTMEDVRSEIDMASHNVASYKSAHELIQLDLGVIDSIENDPNCIAAESRTAFILNHANLFDHDGAIDFLGFLYDIKLGWLLGKGQRSYIPFRYIEALKQELLYTDSDLDLSQNHLDAAISKLHECNAVSKRIGGSQSEYEYYKSKIIQAYWVTGNYKKALELANELIAQGQQNGHRYLIATGQWWRARWLIDHGTYKDALTAISEAVPFDSNMSVNHLRGDLEFKHGHYGEAFDYYRKISRRASGDIGSEYRHLPCYDYLWRDYSAFLTKVNENPQLIEDAPAKQLLNADESESTAPYRTAVIPHPHTKSPKANSTRHLNTRTTPQDPFSSENLKHTPVLMLLTLVLSFLALVFARTGRRKYVRVTEAGLEIGHTPCLCGAQYIPWDDLSSVSFRRPMFSLPSAKRDDTVLFVPKNGKEASIKWNDIKFCIEPGVFINSLKTWAPTAVRDESFPAEHRDLENTKDSYTQLWFKHFSKPSDRQRTGLLSPGEILNDGRYKIVGTLGGGGQGTAYLAIDEQQQNASADHIVLKEYILPSHRGDRLAEQSLARLRQEGEILRKLDHPGIVKVLGEFSEDQRAYLVTEHVDGRTLKELVGTQGAQPESLVIEIAQQLCSILAYLHDQDPLIIHRDITPDNLILKDDGTITLIDFNVAHQLESNATATVVGKHSYIPPEQFRGKPVKQSDIYAMGCTLSYLLTADDPEPLSASHPASQVPTVSPWLDELIAKCTATNVNNRIADISEILQAIASNSTGTKIRIDESQEGIVIKASHKQG